MLQFGSVSVSFGRLVVVSFARLLALSLKLVIDVAGSQRRNMDPLNGRNPLKRF